MKLADALLRRKELQQKVEQLHAIKHERLFETKIDRRRVTESVDDILVKMPKVTMSQLTKEYDFYAHRLRVLDAAIQQTNWTTEIQVEPKVWQDFEPESES